MGGRTGARTRTVLALIAAAAEAGAPCPTNVELARQSGMTTEGASSAVAYLRDRGRLEIESLGGVPRAPRRMRPAGAARWTDWSAPRARRDLIVTKKDGVALVLGVPEFRFRALYTDPKLSLAGIAERLGATRGQVCGAAMRLAVTRPKREKPKPPTSKTPAPAKSSKANPKQKKKPCKSPPRGELVIAKRMVERKIPSRVALGPVGSSIRPYNTAVDDPKFGDAGGKAGRCQWLDGDTRARDFCGAPATVPGGSWCPEHRARVFKPSSASATGSASAGLAPGGATGTPARRSGGAHALSTEASR